MKRYIVLTLLTLLCLITQAQAIKYITQNGAGSKNGSSWLNAGDSSMVQDFISNAIAGSQIWIAKGTYVPNSYPANCVSCNSNRDFTFFLKNGVSIYGGFDGTEVTLANRDTIWPTYLSGEINTNSATDNIFHVITALGVDSTMLLNGFIITNGYANGSGSITVNSNAISQGTGGGMNHISSSIRVSQCSFINNSAFGGGGINTYACPIFIDSCIFLSNKALFNGFGGGAIRSTGYGIGVYSRFNHCIFDANKASNFGGGSLYLMDEPCIITNNFFTHDSATSTSGGAIRYESNNSTSVNFPIKNCVFYQNYSYSNGADIYLGLKANALIANCDFVSSIGGGGTSPSEGVRATGTSYVYIFNTIMYGYSPVGSPTGTVPFYAATGATIQFGGSNLFNINPNFININNLPGCDGIYYTADDGLALRPNSSAVQKGLPTIIKYSDITGYSRDSLQDIGAYEFRTGALFSQSPDSICGSDSITLRVKSSYTSGVASYAWRVGGQLIPSNGTDSIRIFATVGQTIQFVAYNAFLCGAQSDSVSTTYTVKGQVRLLPTISISVLPSTSVCAGTPVSFKSVYTNGGASPVFQWYKNGQAIGINSDTLAPTYFSDRDTVKCVLTSSIGCVTQQSSSSQKIGLKVSFKRVYVKVGATGRGTSWVDAMGDLNAALDSTNNLCDEIWVAKGTYYPNRFPLGCAACTSRDYTFDLQNVNLYGGFAGTETSINQRNITVNTTVLSGNIGNAGSADNCYNVLTSLGLSHNILDGFRVVDGYNNKTSAPRGAGFYSERGVHWLRNCQFVNDSTTGVGGALSIFDTLFCQNCSFESCRAPGGGAVFISSINAKATFENCIFKNNVAFRSSSQTSGGAIFIGNPSSTFSKCLFLNNKASIGGAVSVSGSTSGPNFSNCVFAKNNESAIHLENSSHFEATNCTFYKNSTTDIDIPSGSYSYLRNVLVMKDPNVFAPAITGSNVTFNCIIDSVYSNTAAGIVLNDTTDLDGPDNIWMTADDGLSLKCNSPAIDSGMVLNGIIPTIDVTGILRSGRPDIGAYEVSAFASTPPSVNIAASQDTICVGGSLTFTATSTFSGASPQYYWFKNGVQIGTGATFAASGLVDQDVVVCKVKSNLRCQQVDSAFSTPITVHTVGPPSAPTITANGTLLFCMGDSVILTVSAASAYLWSTSATSQSITVKAGGAYTVTVFNSAGCSAISQAKAVTVYPLPNATISTNGSTSLCTNQSVTLSVPTGNTYMWNTNENTNSITVTQPGNYAVTVTDANSCSAISTTTTVTKNTTVVPTVSISANKTSICAGQFVTFNASSTNGGSTPAYTWYKNGTSLSSVGSTYSTSNISDGDSFFVELTSNVVCAIPATIHSSFIGITVNPLPDAIITTSGSLNLCANQSVTLSVPIGDSYVWSNNETTNSITVSQPGNYRVAVTSAAGCKTVSNVQTVTVNIPATPTITLSGGVLISSSAVGYQWYLNGNKINGATGKTYIPTQSGDYTVIANDAVGCESAFSNAINIIFSGINDAPSEGISVYPIPAMNELFVLTENIEIQQLLIYDMRGTVVFKDIKPSEHSIDISRLSSGIYTIGIQIKNTLIRKKFIKL